MSRSVRALGQQDEAQAAGQDAYRGTRAIINVPFTSVESVDTRRARAERTGSERSQRVADALRVPASVAVCFARAGGNESPR